MQVFLLHSTALPFGEVESKGTDHFRRYDANKCTKKSWIAFRFEKLRRQRRNLIIFSALSLIWLSVA